MLDYAGPLRSETLLRAGTQHLKRLRQRILLTLKASNQHELMHALEVLNILDVGDCLLAGSLDRQETRQSFVRTDFPFTNPLLNGKLHIAQKSGDAPAFIWRSV
jgi:succinate dehydrogenase/fumarate reductase flavoprotein subunit